MMVEPTIEHFFSGQPKQQTIEKFFYAIAMALANWQAVEATTLEIARLAVDPQLPGAFHAGYHGLSGYAPQFRFTSSALEFWFEARGETATSLQATWVELRKRIKKEVETRNKLVHYSTYIEHGKKGESEKVYLEPIVGDYRFSGKRSTPRYKVSDVNAASLRFLSLFHDLANFRRDMMMLESPDPPSSVVHPDR